MTIAHHWNAEGRTIPMRYDTAIEDLIRRSSERESPGHLAHWTSSTSSKSMLITLVQYIASGSVCETGFLDTVLISLLREAR